MDNVWGEFVENRSKHEEESWPQVGFTWNLSRETWRFECFQQQLNSEYWKTHILLTDVTPKSALCWAFPVTVFHEGNYVTSGLNSPDEKVKPVSRQIKSLYFLSVFFSFSFLETETRGGLFQESELLLVFLGSLCSCGFRGCLNAFIHGTMKPVFDLFSLSYSSAFCPQPGSCEMLRVCHPSDLCRVHSNFRTESLRTISVSDVL